MDHTAEHAFGKAIARRALEVTAKGAMAAECESDHVTEFEVTYSFRRSLGIALLQSAGLRSDPFR